MQVILGAYKLSELGYPTGSRKASGVDIMLVYSSNSPAVLKVTYFFQSYSFIVTTMDARVEITTQGKAPSRSVEKSVSSSIEIVEAQGFDEKATKKLVRKIDWHLIPFLSLIYLYYNTLESNWEFVFTNLTPGSAS